MVSYFYRGPVFDGTEFEDERSLIIDGESGSIERYGKSDEIDKPQNSTHLSTSGGILLPGLIDSHIHLYGSDSLDTLQIASVPETASALRAVRDLRRLLDAGYTAVRDMGSKAGTYLRKAVEDGVIEGPDIFTCGRAIAQTGGDDDPVPLPLDVARILSTSYHVDGPWECRRAVRLLARDGANLIKVYASGNLPQRGKVVRQFTLEELRAIVDEAHSTGLRVAAHAVGKESLSNAMDAGVDTIEHGLGLTEEICAKMAAKGTILVPTLTIYTFQWWKTPNPWREELVKNHLTTEIEMANRHGVKIAAGTDFSGASVIPHGQNYKEVVNLSKILGIPQALSAATKVGAECLGIEQTGQLREGARASIIIVKGDLERDLEALEPKNVILTMKDGIIHKSRLTWK